MRAKPRTEPAESQYRITAAMREAKLAQKMVRNAAGKDSSRLERRVRPVATSSFRCSK